MRLSPRSEESYPLLLVFLEDSNKSQKRNKGIFFDNKSRYTRISEGASNVFTQWPSQVTSCWLSTFLLVILFIMMLLILIGATFRPTPATPRCLAFQMNDSDTKIFLVHHGKFDKHQFEAIEEIIQNYPGITVELILLRNSTLGKQHIQQTSNWYRKVHKTRNVDAKKLNINVGQKDVLKTMHNDIITPKNLTKKMHAVKNLKSLLKKYPIITVRNETMEEYFAFSPLFATWKKLNLQVVEFAARALKVWDFGGISFKLPEKTQILQNNPKIRVYNHRSVAPYDEDWRIDTLTKSNWTSFKNLPKGVVNIDDEGVHMETKTACHAYFGELLVNLRKADWNTTVENIVTGALKTFCLTGAVTDEYCFNFITK